MFTSKFYKSSLFVWCFSILTVLSQEKPVEKVESQKGYVLQPNDVVRLSVYEEADLSVNVGILKTGEASFPLIGSVAIGGLELNEAESLVHSLYAKDYLRNPRLTLTVSEYATAFITVIGQVAKPGQVPIPQFGVLDLAGALASVGGITEMADPKNIKLIKASGESEVLTFEGVQGEDGSLKLKNGDQIIVAESPFARSKVAVIGEVKSPGTFAIPSSGQFDLNTALATAGGLSDQADQSNIKVISSAGVTNEYELNEIKTGAAGQRLLKGGDRVVVSLSPFANTKVTLLGQVKRPGAVAFPIDGKLDLMTAIAMSGGFTDLANIKKISLTREGEVTVIDGKDENQGGKTTWLMPNDVISVAERIF